MVTGSLEQVRGLVFKIPTNSDSFHICKYLQESTTQGWSLTHWNSCWSLEQVSRLVFKIPTNSEPLSQWAVCWVCLNRVLRKVMSSWCQPCCQCFGMDQGHDSDNDKGDDGNYEYCPTTPCDWCGQFKMVSRVHLIEQRFLLYLLNQVGIVCEVFAWEGNFSL